METGLSSDSGHEGTKTICVGVTNWARGGYGTVQSAGKGWVSMCREGFGGGKEYGEGTFLALREDWVLQTPTGDRAGPRWPSDLEHPGCKGSP